jgi:phospholipase/carboxylesterase
MTMNQPKTALVYKYFPARQTGTHPPVLILLHGRGADENDLTGLIPHFDARFDVYSIRAPYGFEYGGFTWCVLNEDGTYERTEFDRSLGLVLDFVKELGNADVYVVGFSMGSMMALAAGLTHPEIFKGIVAQSGLVPEQADHLTLRWSELAGCSFCITHGVYDPVVSITHGRHTKELFEKSTAQFVYKEYPMGHEISPESLDDVAKWLTDHLTRS